MIYIICKVSCLNNLAYIQATGKKNMSWWIYIANSTPIRNMHIFFFCGV